MSKFEDEFRKEYKDARASHDGRVPRFVVPDTEPATGFGWAAPAFAIAALLAIGGFWWSQSGSVPLEDEELAMIEFDESALAFAGSEWESPTDFLSEGSAIGLETEPIFDDLLDDPRDLTEL